MSRLAATALAAAAAGVVALSDMHGQTDYLQAGATRTVTLGSMRPPW